jgi:DNA-binding transcriptional MerR regulator
MAPAGVQSVKSPEAFRTISEVAVMLDVPQHVLRFWESRFPQIKPIKRAGGRRFYRPEDVDLLRGIQRLLYFEGYTIRGAQKILREKGVRYTASLGRDEAKKRGIAAEPETASLQPEEDGFDALATLARVREDAAVAFAQESIAAATAPEPIPAAKMLQAEDPRRTRLEALRTELLALKSRLATARSGKT